MVRAPQSSDLGEAGWAGLPQSYPLGQGDNLSPYPVGPLPSTMSQPGAVAALTTALTMVDHPTPSVATPSSMAGSPVHDGLRGGKKRGKRPSKRENPEGDH
jgi:hypothetical protein